MSGTAKHTHRIFIVCLCTFMLNQFCPANTKTRGERDTITFSEAELRIIYDSLPAKAKDFLDMVRPIKRLRALTVRAELKDKLRIRAEKRKIEQAKKRAEIARNSYELDPLLKQAYEAYAKEDVPRKKIIALFEKYIDKDPGNPFLAEIYFRIGALYSIHRREQLGEEKDWKLQKKYYEKAHKLYGEKFCYLNNTAWASLANHSYSTLEFRKEYYDWLLRLKNSMDPNDIYPIREIGQTLNGRPPDLSQEEIQLIASSRQQNLIAFIDTGEKNIMWRTAGNRADLSDLATSYPDTGLGQKADERLKAIDAFFLEFLEIDDIHVSDESSESFVRTEFEMFIPRVNIAVEKNTPFILDLENTKLIKAPSEINSENAYRYFNKLRKGDLAWDGSLIAVRNAKALIVSKESYRPLECIVNKWTISYKLPEQANLPYSLMVITKEGLNCLFTIRKIETDGIRITYKKLHPDEVKHYLPTGKKKE